MASVEILSCFRDWRGRLTIYSINTFTDAVGIHDVPNLKEFPDVCPHLIPGIPNDA